MLTLQRVDPFLPHDIPDTLQSPTCPTGPTPSPGLAAERGAVVQVYGARAVRSRGAFAIHPWIVVKPEGASIYTTYPVISWRDMRGGWAPVITEDAEPDLSPPAPRSSG